MELSKSIQKWKINFPNLAHLLQWYEESKNSESLTVTFGLPDLSSIQMVYLCPVVKDPEFKWGSEYQTVKDLFVVNKIR